MKLRLLLATLLFSVLSWSQVPTNGLVKEYNFIAGPGVQLTDSNVQKTLHSGTVNLTRNGLNGSLTEDRNGNSNSAMFLNGDYLYSGGTEQTYVNEYTISFWMKSSTIDNINSKFIIHQKGSSPQRGFSVELYNGQIRFYNVFGYGNTSVTDISTVFVNSNTNVADGNWHHVVCAVNSTATSTVFSPYVAWTINYYSKVYIDNVLVGNANQTVVPSYTSGQLVREAINRNQPLYIGSYPGNTTAAQKYTDIIDQVKYYERELSVPEIEELFYEEHPQNPIFVNVNAAGNNDGTSWGNAFTNLQTAINNNIYKDDIWVAAGTYTPSGNGRNSTFLISSRVKIYGGFNGTESLLEERDFKNNITVLSGDVNENDNAVILPTESNRSENLYHIVTVKGNLSEAIIDGFTFSGANANGTTLISGTPSSQYLNNRGGAIFLHTYATNANIKLNVENCIFEKNSASDTSVYANWFSSGVTDMNHEVNFKNCIFKNNYSAQNSQLLFIGSSGFNEFHTGNLVNCLFHNNTSLSSASSIYFFTSTANGGNNTGINIELINSTFASNSGVSGNVMRFDNSPRVAIKNSIVYGNGSSSPFLGVSYFSAVYNSIVQGGQFSGINIDPLLNTDYSLQASSPAINTGDNAALPANTNFDLAGNARIVNTTVDIGVYEFDAALSNSSFTSFDEFTVYPNPTSGEINIQSQVEINKVILYSLDGRKLLETENKFLQVTHLPAGMYLLTLETRNGAKGSQKIIKK